MWNVSFIAEAQSDFDKLDGSARLKVAKALEKVRQNPLPASRGGYGKPLGNKAGFDLTGLLKVKLKNAGIRIVYRLEERDGAMQVVVIGIRDDMDVYRTASKRRTRHGF